MDLEQQLNYQRKLLIGGNVKIDFNGLIDYVFPYVNPNDEEWKKQYKYVSGKEYVNDERFRDFNLLKYVFRSIEKYAPWINKVHFIVAYKSQVPEWLDVDCEKLEIVEHKDFIPPAYLPAFNSNTIEAFLYNIPNLSPYFIYGNDDLMFLNKCQPSDFYTSNGLGRVAYTCRFKKDPQNFLNTCKRCYNLIANKYGSQNIVKDINPVTNKKCEFIKQWHGSAVPLITEDVIKVYSDLESEILQSLTMFRDVNKNYNQYINSYYSLAIKHSERIDKNYIGAYTSVEDGNILSTLKNGSSKMICINDTESMTESIAAQIIELLEKRLPNKSMFEN